MALHVAIVVARRRQCTGAAAIAQQQAPASLATLTKLNSSSRFAEKGSWRGIRKWVNDLPSHKIRARVVMHG